MPYPIEDKLVIAVASSALFDLSDSDHVFRTQGEKAYRRYQEAHLDAPLEKGVAFPFVRRFLAINDRFPDKSPVEVVLLSRNSAITGKRVFHSIEHHRLNITRAAFLEGKSPYPYIPAFNTNVQQQIPICPQPDSFDNFIAQAEICPLSIPPRLHYQELIGELLLP